MTETFSATLLRLRSAQKGHARGAPGYSVYVNRRLGRLLAAAAYHAGLTPNQVTLISAACTFVGIAALALVEPTFLLGPVIGLLLALGYALDSADGQLARLRGGGSASGEWLDHFVDATKIAGMHLAVLIGLYRFSPLPEPWLLLPLGFSVVASVTFFGMILNDLLKGKRGVASSAANGGGTLVRSLLLLPTDYGVLCLAFLLWGWWAAFVPVYALLLLVCTAFLILAATKWFRDMAALDAAAPR